MKDTYDDSKCNSDVRVEGSTVIEDIVKEFDNYDNGCRPYKCSDEMCSGCNRDNDRWNKTKSFLHSSLNKVIEERDKILLEECKKQFKPMTSLVKYNEYTDRYNMGYDDALFSIAEFIKNNNK